MTDTELVKKCPLAPQSAVSRKLSQIWSIAIYRGSTPLDLHAVNEHRNPVVTRHQVTDMQAEFVADPFLIFVRGLWYMFFEAMNIQLSRGVIALATSPDTETWTYRQVVLDEPFHLSYPYVFEHGGEYYMIPESARIGSVRLYQADPFPFSWRLVDTLIGLPLADSSVVQFQGRWWLLGSQENRRLHVFHADQLSGPWSEHSRSPFVYSKADRVRPAGRIIPWEGGLLRYAQDCETVYGARVWPNLVTTLSLHDYVEKPAGKPVVGPGTETWNSGGMHHVDPHLTPEGTWLACVDGWFAE
ncbi:MAG TPA: hypothetical protein VG649_05505 [Candidatus Angelobacter sp.]|nr:hypothetical protein [Candidatus Angelobacter sp.]